MANKIIKRISVSVQVDVKLNDEEIVQKKKLLREYTERIFNTEKACVNMTYEEVE